MNKLNTNIENKNYLNEGIKTNKSFTIFNVQVLDWNINQFLSRIKRTFCSWAKHLKIVCGTIVLLRNKLKNLPTLLWDWNFLDIWFWSWVIHIFGEVIIFIFTGWFFLARSNSLTVTAVKNKTNPFRFLSGKQAVKIATLTVI